MDNLSVDNILKELEIKFKNDNVGLVLACEQYRSNPDIYNMITSSKLYKDARSKIVAGKG